MLMGAEGPSARAEARTSQVFLRDRLVPFEELADKVRAVTALDVQAFAAQAVQGPVAAAAIGPKAGLKAAEAFVAKFM
jgi:predicted Zn-dependent peptidase